MLDRDMRLPVSSMPWAAVLPDGRKANGSGSAGTAGIAATVILAAAAILLRAKLLFKFLVFHTTAVMPNT